MKDCRKIIEQHSGGIKSNDTSPAQNLVDDEQSKLDMDSLKKMIIRNNNTVEAVKILNSTRTYRKKLMIKKEIDIRQEFPFYFANPSLVSFLLISYRIIYYNIFLFCGHEQILLDYDEEFKTLGTNGNFIKQWPQYSNAMRKYCNDKFTCEKHTEWADEIENILLLMKALPGKRGTHKLPFKDMINEVIIFKVVCLTVEIEWFFNNTAIFVLLHS